MRFIEKTLIVLSAIGIVMKFTGAAGAGIFIILGMALLFLLYLLGSYFLFRHRETKAGSVWVSLPAGMGFALAVAGIFFKLEYLPPAQTVLFTALLFLVPVMLISLSRRQKEYAAPELLPYFHDIVNRCIVAIFFITLCFSVPQSTLIRFEYRDDPVHAQLVVDFRSDPDNMKKWEALKRYEIKKAFREMNIPLSDTIYSK